MEVSRSWDLDLPDREVPMYGFGTVRLIEPASGSLLPAGGVLLAVDAPGVVLYDLWARTEAGWVQLYPTSDGRWRSHLLDEVPVLGLRLWTDLPASRPVNRQPAEQASGMLVQGTALLTATLGDVTDPGLPPTGVPTMVAWAHERQLDVLIEGLLDEWTEACVSASRVGWSLGIPAGDQVLQVWARTAAPTDRPGPAFAVWLVGEIGRAVRNGLADRTVAEVRDPAARMVHQAAARLVRGLDERLEVETQPPAGVGPKHRESWLVDEEVADRLGNAVVSGVLQPLIALRPVVRKGDEVLLEGEVG
jgi:hypothetical protein